MTELKLRPYQTECIEAIESAWADGMQRPAAVLSTGLGKTVIFSQLISRHIRGTQTRAVVLVHRDELCDQAIRKIRGTDPTLSVGKVKASDNELDSDVVVASVQTLAVRRRMDALLTSGRIGLVVVDEVHHYAS